MTPEGKRIFIIAIFIGLLSFTMFYTIDNTLGTLFKNHDPTDTPANIITVTGDGSSGTGDVQNVNTIQTIGTNGVITKVVTTPTTKTPTITTTPTTNTPVTSTPTTTKTTTTTVTPGKILTINGKAYG